MIYCWRSGISQLEKELADERQASTSYQTQIQELLAEIEDVTSRSEQQQQTISLLVSEKTTLTSQLERLQSAESGETCSSGSHMKHDSDACLFRYYRLGGNIEAPRGGAQQGRQEIGRAHV